MCFFVDPVGFQQYECFGADGVSLTSGARGLTPQHARFDPPDAQFDHPGAQFDHPGAQFDHPGAQFDHPGAQFDHRVRNWLTLGYLIYHAGCVKDNSMGFQAFHLGMLYMVCNLYV